MYSLLAMSKLEECPSLYIIDMIRKVPVYNISSFHINLQSEHLHLQTDRKIDIKYVFGF